MAEGMHEECEEDEEFGRTLSTTSATQSTSFSRAQDMLPKGVAEQRNREQTQPSGQLYRVVNVSKILD